MRKVTQGFVGDYHFINGEAAHRELSHSTSRPEHPCSECGKEIKYPAGYLISSLGTWHIGCVEFVRNEGREKSLNGWSWKEVSPGEYDWVPPK